jgi:hypothetical protein
MNDIEFRKKAIIDPNSKEKEFLEELIKSESNKNMVNCVKDFDNKLSKAFNVDVPDDLKNKLLLSQNINKVKKIKTQKFYYQMAASFMFASLLAGSILFNPSNQSFNNDILALTTESVHSHKESLSMDKINDSIINYGAKVFSAKDIYSAHNCHLGKEYNGIHFTYSYNDNLVDVIFIPNENILKENEIVDNKKINSIITKNGSFIFVHNNSANIKYEEFIKNINWI